MFSEDIPKTPQELLERIRDDYVKNNYLWTGDIYLPAFDENCTFTDPTLSFVGRQTFVTNVANLQPFLKFMFAGMPYDSLCASELRSIQLEETYVQSQWTMKGQFIALPWKPKINVMGRTKFWFQPTNNSSSSSSSDDGVQVYFYEEEWEIPTRDALLQLITPGDSN